MKLSFLFQQLKRKLQTPYQLALKDGLRAGKGVTVMGGVNFGSEPYLISLGDYVRISSKVLFVTHDGGIHAFRDLPEYKDIVKFGAIKVGAHTFIGANSTIMPGVTIGSRAVIGAGSVVNKDVPDETVWAGVPARQICTLREYAERCRNAMPQDFDHDALAKDRKAYLIKRYMD